MDECVTLAVRILKDESCRTFCLTPALQPNIRKMRTTATPPLWQPPSKNRTCGNCALQALVVVRTNVPLASTRRACWLGSQALNVAFVFRRELRVRPHELQRRAGHVGHSVVLPVKGRLWTRRKGVGNQLSSWILKCCLFSVYLSSIIVYCNSQESYTTWEYWFFENKRMLSLLSYYHWI